jgi:NTP pyrophosphatase (non-canonical NTP hydrolase)
MEIQTYQFKATRTLAEIDGNILDDLHMIIGMQTEVAEIADVYKKHIAYKKPIDYVNIKEELGDALWYIANLCNIHGWDLRDILATNIANVNTADTNIASINTNEKNIASINTNATNIVAIQNASANATASAASAAASAASATAAAAALDEFTDTYLGAFSTDPTLDNDGNALSAGDLYFNTVANRNHMIFAL